MLVLDRKCRPLIDVIIGGTIHGVTYQLSHDTENLAGGIYLIRIPTGETE